MKVILLLLLPMLFGTGLISAPPTRIASFGPNGTHWPSLVPTPFMHDTAQTEISVACNWSAIATAISGLTNAQVAGGVRIKVADGTLNGSGPGAGSPQAITGRGSVAWGQRIVICPANGFGKVTITNSRIDLAHNICWAGFILNGVGFTGCQRGAIAWCLSDGFLGVFSESGNSVASFELSEVVDRTPSQSNSDVTDMYAYQANISGWRFDGCYFAPTFRDDVNAHTDTLQFASITSGTISAMTFRDCLYFASNNSAIQSANINGLDFVHTALIGGDTSLGRYPVVGGGLKGDGSYYCSINGAGQKITFTDSLIWQPMTLSAVDVSRPVTSVVNSKTNYDPGTINNPTTGGWTIDSSMNLTNQGLMAEPTTTTLAAMWANPNSGTGVVVPAPPTDAAAVYSP